MSRPLRLHLPGGFYHVTLRGNHRQDIFRTPEDRLTLDGLVAETVRELGIRLHAYCWMSNHIHLLVQVAHEPLGKAIHRIASRYARQFQAALLTTGHLFERRHHAVLVDADAYLLALVRYIHMNPVRGGLVRDPADYPWSSHREYLGRSRVSWVTTGFVLGLLAGDGRQALGHYLAWMGAVDESRWGEGLLANRCGNPQVLGSPEFLLRAAATATRAADGATLESLLVECGRRFGRQPEEIASRSRARQLTPARAWLAREALARGIASISSIARHLGRSESAVRGLLGRHPARTDPCQASR